MMKSDEAKRLLESWQLQRDCTARFSENHAILTLAFARREKDPESLEWLLRYVFTGQWTASVERARIKTELGG